MKPPSPGETPLPAEVAEVAEKETAASGFAEFLRIPEGSSLPAETKVTLQKAVEEITERIYSPLQMGRRTLQQENLPTATRELFAKATKEAEETLSFFDNITQGLKGEGKNVASAVTLAVNQKSENEIVLSVSPCKKDPSYQYGQHLGRLGLVDIHEVAIIVKTAETRGGKEYTPQTIKFIAKDQSGKQVRNFRVEVHSTNEKKDRQHVQVDAEVDGETLKKTHLDVDSLGKGGDALDRFRLLQYSLLHNLSGKISELRNESHGAGKNSFPGLVFEDKGHRRRFENAVSLAKKNLGITVEAEEIAVKEAEGEMSEEMIENLRQATENVSPTLISCLREALYSSGFPKENGVGDDDIVLCTLFGLEPHELTKQEFISLNGKVPRAIEALTNFPTLQGTKVDEREHLVLARAGEKVFDQEDPEALIAELEKLATAQDLINTHLP